MTLFSRIPCPYCHKDQLFQGIKCMECGTLLVLKPVEFIHDGRRQQRGYKKPVTYAEKQDKQRLKNQLRMQRLRLKRMQETAV